MIDNPQPTPNQPVQIQIKDNFAGGEYANAMQVGFNQEEFLLTFLNIVPPSGRVVAKVIASPGHVKRMLLALEESLKKYEEQFGPVTAAPSPHKEEIGFKI